MGTLWVSELTKTVEVEIFRSGEHVGDRVVRVYRDPAKAARFYPVVFRRELCRVSPAFVATEADEELHVADPAFEGKRFEGRSEQAVLRGVMRRLRDTFAAGRGGLKMRRRELVRTLEIGPYDCPGEAPWQFIVRVYRDLGKKSSYFPVVCRREIYHMRRRKAARPANEQIEILEHAFEPAAFACRSARAAEAAIVAHIRGKFEPKRRRA